MSCSDYLIGKKLVPYRIKGQMHPFIDENLQLQLPGLENFLKTEDLIAYNSICSHYSNHLKIPHSSPQFSLFIYQHELAKTLQEASQAYENWKNMQHQLEEVIKQLRLSS